MPRLLAGAVAVLLAVAGCGLPNPVVETAAAAPAPAFPLTSPVTTTAPTTAPTTALTTAPTTAPSGTSPAKATSAPTPTPAPAVRKAAAVPAPPPPPAPAPARAPAPAPEAPEAAAEPAPQKRPGCNGNYEPCVPNDPDDVDCEGGSGNGPSYVAGPVRVTGDDVYGLDSDDDGVGCE